ncbi:MAG: dihydroxyacetone kinase subunit DhaL [Azospirillaceae bacterium]
MTAETARPAAADPAALAARLIDAAAEVVIAHADRLTELDSAIGDGDHGHNMKRGFQAMREQRDAIAAEPPAKALQQAGMALVMKVGGASGPLYGSFLMGMGKAAGPRPPADLAQFAALVRAGVEAVASRGKSKAGEKTMLDVLIPVADVLVAAAAEGVDGVEAAARARRAADDGLAATEPMRASKGRASFLGERSIGHLDPGAKSSCLIVHAACDVLAGPAGEGS